MSTRGEKENWFRESFLGDWAARAIHWCPLSGRSIRCGQAHTKTAKAKTEQKLKPKHLPLDQNRIKAYAINIRGLCLIIFSHPRNSKPSLPEWQTHSLTATSEFDEDMEHFKGILNQTIYKKNVIIFANNFIIIASNLDLVTREIEWPFSKRSNETTAKNNPLRKAIWRFAVQTRSSQWIRRSAEGGGSKNWISSGKFRASDKMPRDKIWIFNLNKFKERIFKGFEFSLFPVSNWEAG